MLYKSGYNQNSLLQKLDRNKNSYYPRKKAEAVGRDFSSEGNNVLKTGFAVPRQAHL